MKTRTPLPNWLLVMAFIITGLSLVLVRAGYAASPASSPTIVAPTHTTSPSTTPAAEQPTPEVKSEGAKQAQPGMSGDYKSLYAQLDEIEKRTGGGKSGKGSLIESRGH